MYISVETQTEVFFLEAHGFRLHNITPPQVGEPERLKTKTLQVDDVADEQHNFDLEPGDLVYVMNNTGKTINQFKI